MTTAREFGRRLEMLLAKRGLSQGGLARRIGVTPAAMSRYVSGDREPRLVTVTAIANELQVPLTELLEDAPPAGDWVIRMAARTPFTEEQKRRLREIISGGEGGEPPAAV